MPSASARSYEPLLQEVETRLRDGRLKVGDRLPGERQLAETFGISRSSVRDALQVLSVMGVVRSSTGSGPLSGTRIVSQPGIGLTHTLRLHIASASLPPEDVVATRIMLEGWGVGEVAARVRSGSVTAEDLKPLDELLTRMEQPEVEAEEFHLLDTQFHAQLTALAGNVVTSTFMDSLREAIRGYVMEAVLRMQDWAEMAMALKEQHRGILAAVEAGDPEEAEKLAQEHIRWFYNRRLEAPAE